ncbi:acyltransferase [Vibrio harveyi]|nr:acyltransferase [Vibrio parahaemolyticus]ELY1987158.1 acyltransferase [Vibrio harveyi]MBM4921239.1 acyltransferase [Vibrio parahaemolyticus]HCG8199120.1 acyltransferase [Vibrio parahaemolyticus]
MYKVIRKLNTFVFTLLSLSKIGSYKSKPKVNKFSSFSKNTHLGNNCHFNGIRVRGRGRVVIGDNFHSGTNVKIINSFHKYDGGNALPYDTDENIDKDIMIGDNVWVGDSVLILGGIYIGEGAIIQAGAVVVSDIPNCSIAGGNPARVFKMRDIDNYNKLKESKRFC